MALVSVNIAADFKQVNNMLNRYGQKAVAEYKKALKDTSIYGLREIKQANPVQTGTSRNAWKWAFSGNLATYIINDVKYVTRLNNGWVRTTPIVPTKAKVLIFEVGKKRAAKSSTTTLLKRYKAAQKALKGKGLSQKEKNRLTVEKSGVVVTNKVSKPARYRGRHFIEPTVDKIEARFMREIQQANRRLIA